MLGRVDHKASITKPMHSIAVSDKVCVTGTVDIRVASPAKVMHARVVDMLVHRILTPEPSVATVTPRHD